MTNPIRAGYFMVTITSIAQKRRLHIDVSLLLEQAASSLRINGKFVQSHTQAYVAGIEGEQSDPKYPKQDLSSSMRVVRQSMARPF